MKCKFCQAQIPECSPVCPACGGADPRPESPEATAQPVGKPGIKPWKVVTAVVLVLALLGGLAAAVYFSMPQKANDIFYQESYTVQDARAAKTAQTVVARMGDKTLTNGELQIYYWMGVYDFLKYYGNYATALGLDLTQPLDAQQAPGEDSYTWQQYFLEMALDTWQRYQAMAALAEESGQPMSEEVAQALTVIPERMEADAQEAGYADANEMLQKEVGAGVTMEQYRTYLNGYYRGYDYYTGRVEAFAPTDEEIEDYFAEHEGLFEENGAGRDSYPLVDVRHILIMPQETTDESGSTTYTEEAWEECRLEAQRILDEWLAGEATEESFAQLAMQYSVDGSASNGGLYTGVTKDYMVEAFDAWIFDKSRQAGDYGLVQTQFGYHVMYFSGSTPAWYEAAKSALLSDMAVQLVEEAVKRCPMEVNYRKIALADVVLVEEE